MYSLPYFKKMLNLNWKKSKIIWIYEKEKKLVFQIRWKYTTTNCINCWLNTSKCKDRKLHKQKTLVKHMPFWWDKIIELELHKRHFKCENCKTDFYEKFAPQEHFRWAFYVWFWAIYNWFWEIYSMELGFC